MRTLLITMFVAVLAFGALAPVAFAGNGNPSGTGPPSQSCQTIEAEGGTTPGHASSSPFRAGRLRPSALEIGCHPAAGPVPSSYDGERRVELDTLRDPSVGAAIAAAGVELRSFADLAP